MPLTYTTTNGGLSGTGLSIPSDAQVGAAANISPSGAVACDIYTGLQLARLQLKNLARPSMNKGNIVE